MGQNASQAIGVAVEKHTDEQQIVGLFVENKLCWVGSWLRNRGFHVTCPGHANCTATMPDADPIAPCHSRHWLLGAKALPEAILSEYFVTQVAAMLDHVVDNDLECQQSVKKGPAPSLETLRTADL